MVDALVLGLHSMVVAEQERPYNLCYKPRAPYYFYCTKVLTGDLFLKTLDIATSVVTEQGVETLQYSLKPVQGPYTGISRRLHLKEVPWLDLSVQRSRTTRAQGLSCYAFSR